MNRGAFSAYQERDDCVTGVTYWSSSLLQCEPCPTYQGVIFSKPSSALQGQAFSSQPLTDVVTLTNTEPFSVVVIPETLALPTNLDLVLSTSDNHDSHSNTSESAYHTEWMSDHSHDTNSSDQLLAMSQDPGSPHSHVTPVSYLLEPNQQLSMKIIFDPSQRIAGTDTSSVLLNVMNTNTSRNDFSSCPGYKFKFDIVARLSMSTQQNHLEGVTAFGYTSAALIMLTALSFAILVQCRRTTRVVCTMQPVFLMTLCLGVFVMGSTLIPISIDDGVASQQACDRACMAKPWLLSIGFSISVSALFSKLWRINKLFSSQSFRRIQVREQDVILPTATIVALNLVMLFLWTVLDPLRWERVVVDNQPWNSYGRCTFGKQGGSGKVFLSGIVSLGAVGFLMTCWQASRHGILAANSVNPNIWALPFSVGPNSLWWVYRLGFLSKKTILLPVIRSVLD